MACTDYRLTHAHQSKSVCVHEDSRLASCEANANSVSTPASPRDLQISLHVYLCIHITQWRMSQVVHYTKPIHWHLPCAKTITSIQHCAHTKFLLLVHKPEKVNRAYLCYLHQGQHSIPYIHIHV